MKLPEFRTSQDQTAASRSTSMASAFMNPQLRPMTERHKAAQHNLNIRARNPDQERELAIAKYGTSIAVAGAVGELAQVVTKIDLSAQQMAMESANAEYGVRMGDFAAREVAMGGKIDPNTNQQYHYGSAERYAEEREKVLAEIKEKHRFGDKRLVHKFSLGVMGFDNTNNDNMFTSGNKHTIEKGKADGYRAIYAAKDASKKIEIMNGMADAGFVTETKAVEENEKFRIDGKIEAIDAHIQSKQGFDSESTLSMLNDPSTATELGIKNVNRLRKKALDTLAFSLADAYFQKANRNMSKDTLRKGLANAMTASYEELGVTNEYEKQELLKRLESEMSSREKILIAKDNKSLTTMKNEQGLNLLNQADGSGYKGFYSDAQKTHDNMIESAIEGNPETGQPPMPIDALFNDPQMRDYLYNQMGDFGVISKDWMSSLEDSMNVAEGGAKVNAAKHIYKITTDPAYAIAGEKMRQKLGDQMVRDAAAIALDPAVADRKVDAQMQTQSQALKDEWQGYKKYLERKPNGANGISNSMASIQEYYDDLGYGEIPAERMGAINQDYLRIYGDLFVSGEAKGSAELHNRTMAEINRRYAPEVRRDGTTEINKGSFYRDSGSVDGNPTENAIAVQNAALLRSDNGWLIDNDEYEVVPRQAGTQDTYALMARRTVDGVPIESPIPDPERMGMPVMVSRQDLLLLDKKDIEADEAAFRGQDAANAVLKNTSDTSFQGQNRQKFADTLLKFGDLSKEAAEIMVDSVDDVKTIATDTLMLMNAHNINTTTKGDLETMGVDQFMLTGSTEYMNLDPEGNDFMWNSQEEMLRNSMIETNAREGREIYSNDRINSIIADYQQYMIRVQKLTPPGENP